MKRTFLSLLALLVVVGLLLVACGGAAPVAQPPAAAPKAEATKAPVAEAPKAKVEVTLWHAYQTGSTEEQTLTTLIDKAKAQFPDMTINVLQIPFEQVFNKWETEVGAGGGPDMYVAPNDNLGNQARGKLVMQLDALLEGKLNNIVPVGVEGMKVGGHLYGVPESAKAVALYYNKSLIDTPPATTDELLKAVKGGKQLVAVEGAYHLFGFFAAFGGKLLDDSGKCVADQGGFVEAMQYLADLKKAGAVFEADNAKVQTLFRTGKAAMYIDGPWALGDYKKDLGDKLGVAPMPKAKAPAGPLNGIDGFYINPNSKNAQAAVDLALFLTSKDSAQIYTDKAGHVPIRTDVKAADPLVAAFAQACAAGVPRPQSAEFGNYWTPFGDMVTKVIEGVSTPEQGVKDACTAMNTANKK